VLLNLACLDSGITTTLYGSSRYQPPPHVINSSCTCTEKNENEKGVFVRGPTSSSMDRFDASFMEGLLRGRSLVLFRSDSTNSRGHILHNKITILFIYIKQKKEIRCLKLSVSWYLGCGLRSRLDKLIYPVSIGCKIEQNAYLAAVFNDDVLLWPVIRPFFHFLCERKFVTPS